MNMWNEHRALKTRTSRINCLSMMLNTSALSDLVVPPDSESAVVSQGHLKPIYPILVVHSSLSSSDSDSDSEGFEDDSEIDEIIVTGSNDWTAKSWSRDAQYSLQVGKAREGKARHTQDQHEA